MAILVITTGGTISSKFDGEKINVVDNNLPVIEKYKKEISNSVEFEVTSPISILSENITPYDFEMLYLTLNGVEYDKYDGVIVTCGSDTIAYISSFIGLLFGDKNICIVATNKLLTDVGANGFYNFVKAIDCIKEKRTGCIVPWKNRDGNMYIYDATTILPVDTNGNIYSFGKKQNVLDNIDTLPILLSKVLMVNPYPLLSYDNFSLEGIKAILHTTYHSATINKEELIKFKEKCDQKGITIYISGIRSNQKLYDTTKELLNLGAIPLYDIAYPCAYIKLLLEYNNLLGD